MPGLAKGWVFSMKQYTASVVGGGSGGRLSMDALMNSERFELVAVADTKQEVCRELSARYDGIRTFTSHEKMFAECVTDIVCVSTWAPSHQKITLDALELPLKGILVEKPLGDTAAAGRNILENIKNRNLPMVVPHNMIVEGCGKDIIARVKNGDIGQLQLVEIECDKWDIINAGIHWLNFFITLTASEPVDHVLAVCDTSTRTYRDGMQVETEAITYVVTRSGVRCVQQTGDYISIMGGKKGALFRIIGQDGLIEYSNMDTGYNLMNKEFPEGSFIQVDSGPMGKHQIYFEDMAQHIDNGTASYSIPESSLMSLEICEAAYLSSRHKCTVTFPLADFVPPEQSDWDPGQPYSNTDGGRDGRKLE